MSVDFRIIANLQQPKLLKFAGSLCPTPQTQPPTRYSSIREAWSSKTPEPSKYTGYAVVGITLATASAVSFLLLRPSRGSFQFIGMPCGIAVMIGLIGARELSYKVGRVVKTIFQSADKKPLPPAKREWPNAQRNLRTNYLPGALIGAFPGAGGCC